MSVIMREARTWHGGGGVRVRKEAYPLAFSQVQGRRIVTPAFHDEITNKLVRMYGLVTYLIFFSTSDYY